MQAVWFSEAGVINYSISFWSIRTSSYEWGLVQDFKLIHPVLTPSSTAIFCLFQVSQNFIIVEIEISIVQCIKSFCFLFYFPWLHVRFNLRVGGCKAFPINKPAFFSLLLSLWWYQWLTGSDPFPILATRCCCGRGHCSLMETCFHKITSNV